MPVTEPPRVITVTLNPAVDVSLEVRRLAGGGKNRALVRTVQGGGGGINVSRCLARLGVPSVALHTAGQETGARLNRLLSEEGLAHIAVGIEDQTREAIVIDDTWSGRSYHVVPPGPRLSEAEESAFAEALAAAAAGCSYLVLTGSGTPGLREDFSAGLLRVAHAAGIRTVLDIAGAQLRGALQEKSFLIRLDRTEAGGLIGRAIETFDDARTANDAVLDTGATDHVITTAGELGAVYSDREHHYEISAPPLTTPARSDACAGDSLVAAVTAQLVQGESCARACAYGVAAAAATVMLPGTDVFDKAAVDRLAPEVDVRRIERLPHAARH
ncbi:1-phosphofructokinase family hexose kinase [Nocardia shimofusensis]|uniref:1-phosphofructokinase family hexose kinase n=1 Tax=Nocardia shimofusensis TaxID=228596 RepID=UPI00082AF2C9|nr:hexose kinase [Nocardia shimofusensis]